MSSMPRFYDWIRHPRPWAANIGGWSSGTDTISGRHDLMRTESHPGYDYHNLNPRGPDIGSNFQLKKHDYSFGSNFAIGADPGDVSTYPDLWGSFGTSYRGDFVAVASNVLWNSDIWPVVNSSSDFTLGGIGTSAIAVLIPTNPVASLAQFIGELHEGLPRASIETLQKRTAKARSAGSDYLNYSFGWRPLVSDLKKISKAVTKQEEILRQYEKNSGEVVKRKMTMVDDIDVSVSTYSARPAPEPYFWITIDIEPGVMTKTTTVKTKRWFSGAFTYYLEPEKSGALLRKVWSQKANKLFGTRLTPELVWNLTPWSWAADWFGNTGDVLHNISAFANDGLVMPYAYVMEEKSITHRYELKGVYMPRLQSGYKGPFNFEQVFTTTVKKRLKASPYGFGLIPELDFSSRQLGIIAALGLSRRGKH